MSEPTRAVVDRIVDDVAVLLVGDAETEARLPAAALPAGAREGTVLLVEPGDPLTVLGMDEEATRRRREQLGERLGRLRQTRGGGRFSEGGGNAGDPSTG